MLPEEKARVKIDKQLNNAGWDIVDRKDYLPNYAMAVKEALMQGGKESDYLLFVDNKAIGVVEAKKESDSLGPKVASQAEHYAKTPQNWYGLWFQGLIPLVYLANGNKIYFKNMLTDSDGDYVELGEMHSPKKMLQLIGKKSEYGALPRIEKRGLRDCQYDAEVNLEKSLKQGKKKALAVLATGSGKTYVNMISYGVKMPRLGTNDGKNAIIAIPPINEQKRIRDKFDIVAPLFDKIQNNLNNLNNEVTAIKSKILDLAIRGKLVPQDPNDEPASVLLERIREEKEELIKQGKIKRDKMESVIFKGDDNSYYEKIGDSVACIDAELPFEIPDNWCWARLNCISINYDSYRKPINSYDRKNRVLGKSKDELYPYYGATGQIGFIDDFLFNGEYILLGEDAAPFLDKKAQKAYMIKGKSWVNNHAHILQSLVFPEYLTNCLNSIDYFDYVYGTTRLKLTQENMNRILVPVPSIEEQCKIAQAINNLFVLIESIKASLS